MTIIKIMELALVFTSAHYTALLSVNVSHQMLHRKLSSTQA
jgi:hypothetical protein